MNVQTVDEKKFALTNIPPLTVTNQLTYETVVAFRVKAKEREKLINETFEPIVEKNRAAWKQALATRDNFLSPVLQIIATIDTNIKTFKREQERKAAEEQERLRVEAEKKATAERAKLEAKAQKALDSGKTEKAEELLEKAENVEALVPTVAPIFEKVKGDTTRKIWRAKVVDFKILDDQYKLPNQQMLDGLARAVKGPSEIRGVQFYCE